VAGDGGASRATTTSPIAFKRTKGKKRRTTIDKESLSVNKKIY
jgi:hypothetical protein